MTPIQISASCKVLKGKVRGMDHYYIDHTIAVKTPIVSKHLLRALSLLIYPPLVLGQMTAS